jgi:glyceraldehyde 3-phosphate dehydrogenase
MKIIINGAGRIGRCLIRKIVLDKKLELSQVNDPYMTAANLCYLLNFDSVYGPIDEKFKLINNNEIKYGEKKIIFSKLKDLDAKKFNKGANILIDSSGVKKNYEKALKFKNKKDFKVLITHTFEKADIQIIFGVNENKYNTNKHKIISTSICDAVAIAPVLNLINERFKLDNGSIITLHPWLGYQNLVDGPSRSFAYPGQIIDNFSLGRASTEALISKKTSCVDAINSVIPGMLKKFSSMSFRVPTQIVSSAHIYMSFKEKFNLNKFLFLINDYIKKQKNNIFAFNKEECISKDFIANDYSTIIDHRWIEVKNNKLRLILWYDNEFGYSSRVIDLIKKIKKNEKI